MIYVGKRRRNERELTTKASSLRWSSGSQLETIDQNESIKGSVAEKPSSWVMDRSWKEETRWERER